MSTSARAGGHLFIPDLHGHLPRLQAALQAAQRFPDVHLVFLGDLIDDSPERRSARQDHRLKGTPDDSPEVLRHVRALHDQGRATVLLGNHEVMAIHAVLEGHWDMQSIWWAHGGRETAAAYGWRPGHSGALAEDLRWLREHGRLWLAAGPASTQVLAAHATRPHPEHVKRGLDHFEQLLPPEDFDPVVWFPLEDTKAALHPLSDGCTASVHGHMQQSRARELRGPDGTPAFQIDLQPKAKKLALLYLSPQGEQQIITPAIR